VIVEPGMRVRAFHLDGSAVIGDVVSGPIRKEGGGMTNVPVVINVIATEGTQESFPSQLVEPYGQTLAEWYTVAGNNYWTKVGWDTIAYAILDDMLAPGHWSAHMGEYVQIDWKKRTIKNELRNFHGSNYDGPEVVKTVVSETEFLERLGPAMWKYQEGETVRIAASIVAAATILKDKGDQTPRAISVPNWASDFVPGALAQVNESMGWELKLRVVQGPFPMLMTKLDAEGGGTFVRLPSIAPYRKGW